MNEQLKQAQETLLELSGLALKYLINNFHFVNEEYVERKSQIGNLTENIRISLNNFYGYKDSQQDLIKSKDEYIAKLCCDRAELKEQLKQVKDILAEYGFELKDFREACLLLKQWRSENLCWADYEKQKAELNELKDLQEFARYFTTCSTVHDNDMWIGKKYFEREVCGDKKFDLVKKVAEKYGK